tara:strand:+ start:63 stop:221 length:159 start_codon:yes stop_codon:yes gene_type:complete
MEELEMDTKVLKKNLEITKLLQDKDRLIAEVIDLREMITELQQHILKLNETK